MSLASWPDGSTDTARKALLDPMEDDGPPSNIKQSN